jgi:hypothetical protein
MEESQPISLDTVLVNDESRSGPSQNQSYKTSSKQTQVDSFGEIVQHHTRQE